MKLYDVLIVEDDLALCEALYDILKIQGYHVLSAKNGTEALLKLSKNSFKLVVSDVQMPVMDGLQLLQNMRSQYSNTPILLMTAYGTIAKAVEAIQLGAADYLVKPFAAETLVDKVQEFIADNKNETNHRVVKDDCMKKLYTLAAKVAKTDVTVLLQGESGTGKEVIAQFIHQNSRFDQGPFVAVNCAAIPENMLEAMLFGYEKGAFTGAIQSMPGKFEQAQRGTIFLDEISEMDIQLQAKILRVIQEKEVERLGSQRKIALNVRILAATNRKLKEQVDQGRFREDLYFRLNVFPLKIPTLCERPGDIMPLAENLMRRYWHNGKSLPFFDASATEKMLAYHWPGNVRELENVVQRALILLNDGKITAADLIIEEDEQIIIRKEIVTDKFKTKSNRDVASLDDGLKSAEEKIILQTLEDENGNRKLTAEKLGISPRTLRYKIARMKQSGLALPC